MFPRLALSIFVVAAFVSANGQAEVQKVQGKRSAKAVETASEKKAPAYGEIFDFRGIKLGMTQAEFKAAEIPKEAVPSAPIQIPGMRQQVVSSKAECTNDEGAADTVKLFVRDKDIGVTECAWVIREESYSTSARKSPLYAAGAGVKDYRFRFIALPGEEPKLFSIELETRANRHQELVDALTTKFGPPAESENGTVQNRMGATFENNTVVWENATGQIKVLQRALDIETGLTFFYLKTHFVYFAKLAKDKKEKNGPGV
ncbi:hypothetical protein [Noviherbaspirillum suwonense]|uniref:Lipoprotein n=1 Tax=Noviherbaspirillum suwonense TaxID=1224511 RepID=A0ABY1QKG2_9BURK|nr:hypothetical protein [Noviherbaspirillum suwonense]SMP71981.1 hypothetical protein SAMN06295970_117105 [Noviherbaspirillum suwonense]